jgi:hypothetical protein
VHCALCKVKGPWLSRVIAIWGDPTLSALCKVGAVVRIDILQCNVYGNHTCYAHTVLHIILCQLLRNGENMLMESACLLRYSGRWSAADPAGSKQRWPWPCQGGHCVHNILCIVCST